MTSTRKCGVCGAPYLLTPREREVADLLDKGMRPVDVSRKLKLTKARISQLMDRLQAKGFAANGRKGKP